MDIGIAFLVGVLVGQWIILWALWRASMKLIEMLSEFQKSSKDTPSRNKAIFIPNDDFLDVDIEETTESFRGIPSCSKTKRSTRIG